MGKFRSGVATVMAMWSCAAYAQAQDAPPAPQGNQEVSQRQVEELSRAAVLLDQEQGSVARPELPHSRGPGGGFSRGAEVTPGVIALTPTQNLLILGVILTFDSHFQP